MPTYSIQVSQRGAGGIDTVSTFNTLAKTELAAVAYQKRLFPRAIVISLGEILDVSDQTMSQMIRAAFGAHQSYLVSRKL
jgi:hypothetical protein